MKIFSLPDLLKHFDMHMRACQHFSIPWSFAKYRPNCVCIFCISKLIKRWLSLQRKFSRLLCFDQQWGWTRTAHVHRSHRRFCQPCERQLQSHQQVVAGHINLASRSAWLDTNLKNNMRFEWPESTFPGQEKLFYDAPKLSICSGPVSLSCSHVTVSFPFSYVHVTLGNGLPRTVISIWKFWSPKSILTSLPDPEYRSGPEHIKSYGVRPLKFRLLNFKV